MMTKQNSLVGKFQFGFSMIEILVSISIFVVLSIISVNLFFRTTIGSTKDNTTRSLKQTGDHIISVLDDSLRSAGGLNPNQDNPAKTCDTNMRSISINNLDKSATEVWTVTTPSQGNSQIMVNGQPITSSDISVVNNRLFIDCTLDVNSGVTFVKVSFTLAKKSGSFESQTNQEKSLTEKFETSVTIRNR